MLDSMNHIKTALKWVYRCEEGLLALLLLAMIVLAASDIIMRSLGGGIAWIPPAIRVLVLWLGLLGALLATRDNQHISIDLLADVLKPGLKRWSNSLIAGFSAVVCGIVAWHSAAFVQGTFEFQDTAFSGLPAWPLQLVIPASFGLMALRFTFHCIAYALSADYQPQAMDEEQQGQS